MLAAPYEHARHGVVGLERLDRRAGSRVARSQERERRFQPFLVDFQLAFQHGVLLRRDEIEVSCREDERGLEPRRIAVECGELQADAFPDRAGADAERLEALDVAEAGVDLLRRGPALPLYR